MVLLGLRMVRSNIFRSFCKKVDLSLVEMMRISGFCDNSSIFLIYLAILMALRPFFSL